MHIVDGAKVKSSRRLVEDDKVLSHIDFSRNDRFLLVAAGQGADRDGAVRSLDGILRDLLFSILVHALPADPSALVPAVQVA